MPSILDYIAGNVASKDYYAEDPYFAVGKNILSIPIPAARNNTEAFLMPFLQGTLGGALAGYGKSQANQAAYQDVQESPYMAAFKRQYTPEIVAALEGPALAEYEANPLYKYLSEEMPEGYSAKSAAPDTMQAMVLQSAIQEERAKKEEKIAELASQFALETHKSNLDIKEEAAKGTKPKEIPAAVLGSLGEQKGIIDAAVNLGTTLQTGGKTWASLQGASMFAGLDEDGIAASVQDLADRVMRSRTGATAPPAEAATIRRFIAGDRTVTPQQMGSLLLKFAERERQNALSQVELITSPDITEAFKSSPVVDLKAAAVAELRRRGKIP